MVPWLLYYAFFVIAAIPFIYYLIAIYSTQRFFRVSSRQSASAPSFTPPVSILKPVRGLDPDAYENFASFCRQDYPEYEIVFCVGDRSDPVLPIIETRHRRFSGVQDSRAVRLGPDCHQRQGRKAGAPHQRGALRTSGYQRQRRARRTRLPAHRRRAARRSQSRRGDVLLRTD